MRPFPNIRRYRQLPILWWCCAVITAIVAGLVVSQAVARARQTEARFGETIPVVVTTRALNAGTPITDDDVQHQRWPRSFVPDSKPVSDVNGRVAVTNLAPGTAITELDVGQAGLGAVASLLRDGEQGVTVAQDNTHELTVGQGVDVLATFDRSAESAGDPTTVVVADARVLAVDDKSATVAVPAELAPRVAFASVKGVVTLALTRPLGHD